MAQSSISQQRQQGFLVFILLIFMGLIIGGIALGLHLRSLYAVLGQNFRQINEFTPTLVYSDLAKIQPNETRSNIEMRLKNLNYRYESFDLPGNTSQIKFVLHPQDYPDHLLPDGHLTRELWGKKINLTFINKTTLQSITSEPALSNTITEFYLEPELVATLSKNNPENHSDIKKQIRTYIPFNEFSPQIWQAVLAVEDPHFLEHKGIDPRGIIRAVFINLKNGSLSQGGSTISAQLVKNLMERRGKNIFKKINELLLTLMLELNHSKEEILERYLNEVYLGQVGSFEVHGVEEGAKLFFNKNISELNLAECALLASLIRGPAYYSPYKYLNRVLEREHFVLKRMVDAGFIAEGQAAEAAQFKFNFAQPHTSLLKSPYFIDYAKDEVLSRLQQRHSHITEEELMTKGYRIYTTLDSVLNTQAQAAVLKGVTQISKDTPLQGALVSVENSTGFIRSLIGGKNYSESNFNRILNMRRQVGSTFKPIIWLTAYRLEDSARQLPYSPQTYVYDGPFKLIYDRGKQSWSPKNYEKTHLGWVTMNQALAHSINTVTARLTEELGIDNIIATARSLGIQSDIPRVPSLGLGSLELSPMELTSVYLNFAQETHRKIPMSVRAITDREGHTIDRYLIREEEILIPPAAIRSLVTSMEAVFTEGTAQSAKRLGWNYPSAGKTGTTSQSNDAWFAGFTSEMTTVVWVGPDKNLNNKKLKITGAQAALPIWVETMKAAAQSPTELIPTTADTSSTTTPLSAPTTSPSTTLQSTSYD